jgi:hypothetical protein
MPPSTTSKITTNHDEIRRWAEERGARPVAGNRTILLAFSGDDGDESLIEIPWDRWFEKFERRKLALLYQEQTAGGERSNFNETVSRETAKQVEEAVGGKGRCAVHKEPKRRRTVRRQISKRPPKEASHPEAELAGEGAR